MNVQNLKNRTDYAVIVPTQGTRDTLDRALGSALSQTLPPTQIFVVVDGESVPESVFENHDRIVWTAPVTGRGGQLARLRGVQLANTAWIAFLDDDDWWAPEKMALQLGSSTTDGGFPILSCRCHVSFATGQDVVLPRTLPEQQPIGEYLFRRTSMSWGDALIQTSTLVVPREQAEVALRPEASIHQDWDLLLALERQGGELRLLPQALTYYETGDGRRVSNSSRWRDSLDWGRYWRSQMGPESYSSFVLVTVAGRTRGLQRLTAIPRLLAEGVFRGRPTPRQLLLFAGLVSTSPRLRRAFRRLRRS